MMHVRPLPKMPDFVKGVINLRKKIIPIIDMRQKFNMESVKYTDKTCIIIVEISALTGSALMGIIVDTVFDAAVVDDKEVQDAPEFEQLTNIDYIAGIAVKKDYIITLLDIDRVFNNQEKSAMAIAS